MSDYDEAMNEYLAAGGRVTRCPEGVANATPLRMMRRRFERQVESDENTPERRAERRMEAYGAARENGASVSDALDDARDAEWE